jgi:hypothetical protein
MDEAGSSKLFSLSSSRTREESRAPLLAVLSLAMLWLTPTGF